MDKKYPVFSGKRVLVVEDSPDFSHFLEVQLGAKGFLATCVDNEKDALEWVEESSDLDVAILDMYVPSTPGGGYDSVMRGERIAVAIRSAYPDCIIVGISNKMDTAPRTHITNLFDSFFPKINWDPFSEPKMLWEDLENHLAGGANKKPRAFIVHGHDEALVEELTLLLRDTYDFPTPIVLRNQPDGGRTIIEKFEAEAMRADIVFVCMTPDDLVSDGPVNILQARQNVLFELGFFYAKFQRRKGRVILLVKDDVGIPSDLMGIVWLDVSGGLVKAKDAIDRELHSLGYQV